MLEAFRGAELDLYGADQGPHCASTGLGVSEGVVFLKSETMNYHTSNDKRICRVAAPSEQSKHERKKKPFSTVLVVSYRGYFLMIGCAGSICHGGLNVGAGDTVKVLANEYRIRP